MRLPDHLLSRVEKPSRYLGDEINSIAKADDDVDFRVALIFPDLYEIGISHYGLLALYEIINRQPRLAAERFYHPAPDAEQLIRAEGVKPLSMETARPLDRFDMLGFTLPYELCFTNVINMLDLAGIPLRREDRASGEYPIILGGGCQASTPEPVADFFDLFFFGEAEQGIVELMNSLKDARARGESGEQLIGAAIKQDGIYAPAYYKPRYLPSGEIETIEVTEPAPAMVKRVIVADIADAAPPTKPIVPYAPAVHDRLSIEISRGCGRACRFCGAGSTYRPLREREAPAIIEAALTALDSTGYDNFSLLSLSAGDYTQLAGLIENLSLLLTPRAVALSMPSMRIGSLTSEQIAIIKRVRKTGFTFAPEAGSERLRRSINKNLSDEEIIESCRLAFSAGWNMVKLYFMIGLPGETDEDIEAIIDLCHRIKREAISGRGRAGINVSINPFVPKPHTPFERSPLIGLEEIERKMSYLKKGLRGIKMKWNSPKLALLEAIFSRGDRRLSDIIEQAWRAGARLDGWSDYFRHDIWDDILERNPHLAEFYAYRRRGENETLPYSMLDSRIDAEYFAEEVKRAAAEKPSDGCIDGACDDCGVCDRTEVDVQLAKTMPPTPTEYGLDGDGAWDSKVLIRFKKRGRLRFISHLELISVMIRAARRARLPLMFSGGHHPRPKASFGPALPVGAAGLDEWTIFELTGSLDAKDISARLSETAPPGLEIIEVRVLKFGEKITEDKGSLFEIDLGQLNVEPEKLVERIAWFHASEQALITRRKKNGKVIERDAKKLVYRLEQSEPEYFEDGGPTVMLGLLSPPEGSLKPEEIISLLIPGIGERPPLRIARLKRLVD